MTMAEIKTSSRQLTINVTSDRFEQLETLARSLGRDIDILAAEFLDSEIEAQHGLRFGPIRRAHIYRA